MREILFRGKRERDGEWEYGDLWCNPYGKRAVCIVSPINDQGTTGGNEVIPETVGQYTGLTDRNGKRIFEGDILGSRYYHLSPDNVAVEVVKWFCNGWVIQEGDRPPTMLEEDEIMPYSVVIGNVHDNKGLWGGNEE